MARGWESKGVEAQREAAAAAPARKKKPEPSAPAEQDRVRKREDLQLARKRVMADLATARHPRHRDLLERTLADLEKQISALGGEL
ncbi:MAG TPA: hypothetical protein VJW51_04620 [Candidatus Acidoferrales bacterium]|nr:hypothetical protein [Candidatus Acidoferrales bacterium]